METVKEKIESLNGKISRNDMEDILRMAITELSNFCLSGIKIFQNDNYILKLLSNNLINQNTVAELKDILLIRKDLQLYESYIYRRSLDVERIYAKYFRSYTIIDENGQIYNRIIGMYWNKKSEVWENTDSNGWYHFTAFMPYTKNSSSESSNSDSSLVTKPSLSSADPKPSSSVSPSTKAAVSSSIERTFSAVSSSIPNVILK